MKMTDCIDCPDVEIHGTGSTLWLSCRHVSGWRPINSKCVLENRATITVRRLQEKKKEP